MKTIICSTCGCSLIRLGISQEQAIRKTHQSRTYVFCCQGCLQLFNQNPEKYLEETLDIKVCPTCLAEKPVARTLATQFEGEVLHFCRCPYCLDTFNKNPQYYLDRLAGRTDFEGLFSDDKEACCH